MHDCLYYPCHKGLTDEEFDCTYCYCPLYYTPNCGGNYVILDIGIKDCSHCTRPHTKKGAEEVYKLFNARKDLHNG